MGHVPGTPKTGGRKIGTPNRKVLEVSEILKTAGHDPIIGMIEIARDPKTPADCRGRMNSELAQYVYPKRKALELAGDTSRPIVVHIKSVLDP